MAKEKYLNTKYESDEDYKDDIRIERRMENLERETPREQEIREVRVPVKRAMPRLEEAQIESIKASTPQIIGSLFDRVDFLKARMDELSEQLVAREAIHKQTIVEVDEDIKEKQGMLGRLGDIDEIRNFKLDISILRKEKRQENILYWKDMLELKRELREISEKLQSETKILKIFENLKDKEGGQAV